MQCEAAQSYNQCSHFSPSSVELAKQEALPLRNADPRRHSPSTLVYISVGAATRRRTTRRWGQSK